MHPRQDSFGYQKQKYGAHTESDSGNVKDERTNKEYTKLGNIHIKKVHQFAGKTFIAKSEDIVDKLCIDQNSWFQLDLTGEGIFLRIPNLN